MCFVLFISIVAHSQTKKFTIRGRITNRAGKGIEYAAVQNTVTGVGINADARGEYILKTVLPTNLSVFALGYLNQQKDLQSSAADTIQIDFVLEPDISQLQMVTVTANHDEELVTDAPNLKDFEIRDGKLWLIYSLKKKSTIEVTDSMGKPITQITLAYRVYKDSINHTPHGFLYSMHNDSVILYKLKNNAISTNAISIDTYNKFSNKLIGYRYPYYYYVDYDMVDTRVNYSYFNKHDSIKKVFYQYKDSRFERSNRETKELLLALEGMMPPESGERGRAGIYNRQDTLVEAIGYIPNRATLKELLFKIFEPKGASYEEVEDAMNEASEIINDRGPNPLAVENEQERLSMISSKPFTLLRIANDSVYIFNFDNNTMSVHSPDNYFVREVPFGIYIHSINYRKKDIIMDGQSHECYFKYVKWAHTYLCKINLATGKISYTIELKYSSVDKICIWGGYAYFSYSDVGTTYLYKQKLD